MNLPILIDESICNTCKDRNNCPMPEALDIWASIIQSCVDKSNVPEDIYDEYSIDDPLIEDGVVRWCPLHCDE